MDYEKLKQGLHKMSADADENDPELLELKRSVREAAEVVSRTDSEDPALAVALKAQSEANMALLAYLQKRRHGG